MLAPGTDVGTCAHDSFAAWAESCPDALAVTQGEWRLTYKELNDRARALALQLRARGLKNEARLALVCRPSPFLIVAELAAMKAGCAFVPVDPAYPRERIGYILEDCQAELVLTTRADCEVYTSGQSCLFLEDIDTAGDECAAELPPSSAERLVYVIYTSGSTGRPKGVMIEHGNLNGLVHFFRSTFDVNEHDRSAMLSSSSFDASIADIWPYLASGASVHIPEIPHAGNLTTLFDWFETQRITTALIPTALADLAIRKGFPETTGLRLLLTGGDQLQHSPRTPTGFRFINAYGPTECTVISTWAELQPDPVGKRPPAIGKAIPGAYIRILDEKLQPTAIGVAGELYIGGAGLARGYMGREDLTQERFIGDPFAAGQRIYRTGDRACWRADGDIAFLGRVDRQVQIRGFRVEPGEIEYVLKQVPFIDDAVVVPQARDGFPTRLVGFLASSAPTDEVLVAVREKLKASLPFHLHPGVLVVLPQFPYNAHGKVAVASLPMPAAPSVQMEQDSLKGLWGEVLGVNEVDPEANFFDTGGDSISLTILLDRIETLFGTALPLALFLQNPTLRYTLELLREGHSLELPTTLVPLAPGTGMKALFLVGGAGGGVHCFRELAEEMKLECPVYGLESQGLTGKQLEQYSIAGVAEAYLPAIRHVQPSGPYVLGGYSLGGLVALELAERLQAAGEKVERIILLDVYAKLPTASPFVRAAALVSQLAQMSSEERAAFLRDKWQWLRHATARRAPGKHQAAADQHDEQKLREIVEARRYMREDLRPFHVNIDLFVVRYGTRARTSMADRGWAAYAAAGLEIREVTGDHYSFLKSPYVVKLAAELRQLIGSVR